MNSPDRIVLLAGMPEPGGPPAGLAASLLFHGLAVAIVSFGVFYVPPLDPRPLHEHLSVRRIVFDSPQAERRRATMPHMTPVPASQRAALRKALPSPHPAHARQTLLQPALERSEEMEHRLPLPTVALWTDANTRSRRITAPRPKPPTAADVAPATDPPNLETKLDTASLVPQINASLKLPAVIAATTPIRIHAPDRPQAPPQTVAQTAEEPTPAAVLSLSELRMMPAELLLPAIDQSAEAAEAAAGAGGNTATSKTTASQTAGLSARDSTEQDAFEAAPRTASITLPRDGQFGAVVVGASLEDQFPELAALWRGRMAYTVYLHVGLARSWILAYALAGADEAAAGGAVANLEAPWPFSIVRPNLNAEEIGAEALIVHGYVNAAGRFEDLQVVLPADFADARFVLDALGGWQFRPATRQGVPVRVEVLLVIPQL
jgi:hypothetical protein